MNAYTANEAIANLIVSATENGAYGKPGLWANDARYYVAATLDGKTVAMVWTNDADSGIESCTRIAEGYCRMSYRDVPMECDLSADNPDRD